MIVIIHLKKTVVAITFPTCFILNGSLVNKAIQASYLWQCLFCLVVVAKKNIAADNGSNDVCLIPLLFPMRDFVRLQIESYLVG